ncbi:MAG: adenylyl-sulfate kinase [Planctomycetes bacterium]|nr:adenylyl-sulfate kinase [Planctomycetota bacterium]NUQ34839.1 adenylyl-sulfate kinase [Planctomycetaceae bacterium]
MVNDLTALPRLKVAIVGHVDHGKSTVLGRLMYETGQVPQDRFEKVQKACKEQGKILEYAFLLDALEEEQAQGITIDVSHIFWKTPTREVVFVDAPGHKEFLKNMVSGASGVDAALLVIDARDGVCEQSRRHGFLLNFLGIPNVVVAINKMDLVGYKQQRFDELEREYSDFLKKLGLKPVRFIPVSGLMGGNIAAKSTDMPWYTGPSLASALVDLPEPQRNESALRYVVQDVYKFDERRIIAGRIESGQVKVGDELVFLPSEKTAKVATIERWSAPAATTASAGESVGLTFTDQIFIERGEIGAHGESAPKLSNILHAKVFWLGERPMAPGKNYGLKLGTQNVGVTLDKITSGLDTVTLERRPLKEIERSQVGEVVLKLARPLAFDDFQRFQNTGRFVILDGDSVCGGGIIDDAAYPDLRRQLSGKPKSENIFLTEAAITPEEVAREQGYAGAVVWLTGLSGAGKSTLAKGLRRALHVAGVRAFVLDGDNLRYGLNSDLGFSPDDRAENVRRVAEVAKLMQQAGMVVIVSLISPYRTGRDFARSLTPDRFLEIFVDCPLDECERRDVKGLYKKMKAGGIAAFTGVSAPYEAPANPELRIPTAEWNEEQSLRALLTKLRDLGVPVP